MWLATTRGEQSTWNEEDGVRAMGSKRCFTKVALQNRAIEKKAALHMTPEASLDK